MNWKELKSIEQLDEIIAESYSKTQVIFKHSTRCFISKTVKRKFEKNWSSEESPYLLDLIANRDVSNMIANSLNVQHQSPQIIVIADGKVIHHASHDAIDATSVSGMLITS